MPSFNGFLIRDSLSDDGTTPSPGYPYMSPDMICYPQVANPVSFFQGNYGSDVNQTLEYGQWNYIYVRAKNLSATPQSGSVYVYYSRTSLVMNTDQWSNQGLSTAEGASSVALPQTSQNGIAVGSVPFAWRPPGDSPYGYCMIGRVVTTALPNPIPGPFTDWNSFVSWVRNNQNVCWRNITILNNYPNPQWDQLSVFQNVQNQQVPAMFTATASDNIPVGTTLTLKCTALNINASQAITSDPATRILTASGMCPANFVGNVETMGLVPTGQSWPTGGTILTQAYIGQNANLPIAKYATPWHRLPARAAAAIPGLRDNGVLVQVGSAGVTFVSS